MTQLPLPRGLGERLRWFFIPLLLTASACGEEASTPTPTLPAEVTAEATEPADTTPFPGGVISPGGDETPAEQIVVTEVGRWVMSPPGGPYDAMSGELTVTEAPPGATEEDTPLCRRVFTLSGSILDPATAPCPGCTFALRVEHVQSEGQGLCTHPDIPAPGEIRGLGFVSAEGAIYFDYRGSGTWLPWYDATRQSDIVTYSWSEAFGYLNPAEEDN